MDKLQIHLIRLVVILGFVGLFLQSPMVVRADSAVTPTVTLTGWSADSNDPMDVWKFILPLQSLGEMAIRLMSGIVGIVFAVGAQKSAFVANLTHQAGMANQAAASVFSLLMGVGFFMFFWMLPGIIQYIYKTIVTPQMVNDMSNLDWLHSVGTSTTPVATP